MVTFNVDSLDFVDDEEARFGAESDFATRFDSANSRLELEDLTAGAVGYVPQGTSTDLVGGKFAETVSEGKALADDGSVYDTIEQAVDNANSWVKVGPGDFRESVSVTTTGLTLEGSGRRTRLLGDSNGTTISIDSVNNVTISSLYITSESSSRGVNISGDDALIQSVIVEETASDGIRTQSPNTTITNSTIIKTGEHSIELGSGAANAIIVNNIIEDSGWRGISADDDNIIISGNILKNTTQTGIYINNNDSLIGYNRIISCGDISETDNNSGIDVNSGTDNIIYKNRVSDSAGDNIQDGGEGTVLDSNLTTE